MEIPRERNTIVKWCLFKTPEGEPCTFHTGRLIKQTLEAHCIAEHGFRGRTKKPPLAQPPLVPLFDLKPYEVKKEVWRGNS